MPRRPAPRKIVTCTVGRAGAGRGVGEEGAVVDGVLSRAGTVIGAGTPSVPASVVRSRNQPPTHNRTTTAARPPG
jgi:hypothetical protein